MKILLSINHKFFEKSPKELIDSVKQIDVNNYVKGFEIYINFNDKDEVEYVKNLKFLCDKEGYLLQFHGDSSYSIELQEKYFKFLNDLSNGQYMNVVLHPLSLELIEDSIRETNLYFSKLLNIIYENRYKIKISIENLNSINTFRLSKDYLKSVLSNNMDLQFTYDIGHETVDYGKITDLDSILIDRLSNVHIHTFDINNDHQPIGMNDHKEWVKAIQYLNYLHFDGTLVLEYDFYTLGNDFKERMTNYIKCVEYMQNYV